MLLLPRLWPVRLASITDYASPLFSKLENYDDVTFADEETGFEIFGVVTHAVNDMSMSEFLEIDA